MTIIGPDGQDETGGSIGWDASDAWGDPNVGAFRQGSANSQWALGRYLVGRAVAEALGRGLLILAVALLIVAGLVQWAGATFWTVVIVILAVGVLLLRSLVLAVLRRLSAVQGGRAVEQRLGELVADTRKDVLRELRRLGLPGRSWTLPFLAVRLIGKRRQDTATKLRQFDVDKVVPVARLDELHLLLRSAGQGPVL